MSKRGVTPVVILMAAAVLAARPAWSAAQSGPGPISGEPMMPAGDTWQLARTDQLAPDPLGAADVFGNGPYDLFTRGRKVYPFVGFTESGAPRFARPRDVKGPINNAHVFTLADGAIVAVEASGKKLRAMRFDRDTLTFTVAGEQELPLENSIKGKPAACLDERGRLHVFFSTAGPAVEYHSGNSHAHDYIPYDGKGTWRGGIPRDRFFHAAFDGFEMKRTIACNRVGPAEGLFLFGKPGLTVANLGPGRERAVITTEKQCLMRLFALSGNGTLADPVFVNNTRHVALRHDVINANAQAYPDPKTGLSNLIVSDTGRVWFYPFTGEFSPNGSPIYGDAQPVIVEGGTIGLGDLPVISPGDIDGDGLTDLLVGNDAGHVLWLRNVGTPQRAAFADAKHVNAGGGIVNIKGGYNGSLQGPGEAMWGYTCPTLHDWNGDGKPDIILNSIRADYLVLLQEESENGQPRFTEPRPIYCDGIDLHLAWRSQPAITDWGKPGGRLAMIALDETNRLRLFWRIDDQNVERGELLKLTTGQPILANDEGAGQTGRAKLVATDFDGDGAIDLLVGCSRGLSFPRAGGKGGYPDSFGATRAATVLLLRNAGTNDRPVFEHAKLVLSGGEMVRLGVHSCSPAMIDLGGGKPDLLVAEENGSLRRFPRASLSLSAD